MEVVNYIIFVVESKFEIYIFYFTSNFICVFSAADSGRVMQEQMASGGGMMGPQADPQKAFEVGIC